jgi:hypothetical protein
VACFPVRVAHGSAAWTRVVAGIPACRRRDPADLSRGTEQDVRTFLDASEETA